MSFLIFKQLVIFVLALGKVLKCDEAVGINFSDNNAVAETFRYKEKVELDADCDKVSNDGRSLRQAREAPKFLVKCQSNFLECKNKTGKNFSLKIGCFQQFSKCFEENRPPLKPQTPCEITLYHCLRDSRGNTSLRLQCYSGFCSCHLSNCPELPPNCSTRKRHCFREARWDKNRRKICIKKFRKCAGFD